MIEKTVLQKSKICSTINPTREGIDMVTKQKIIELIESINDKNKLHYIYTFIVALLAPPKERQE